MLVTQYPVKEFGDHFRCLPVLRDFFKRSSTDSNPVLRRCFDSHIGGSQLEDMHDQCRHQAVDAVEAVSRQEYMQFVYLHESWGISDLVMILKTLDDTGNDT